MEKKIRPNYWLCGGGDLNCPHWDDINGCWNGCEEFGDERCTPPETEEDSDEDYEDDETDILGQ